MRDNDKINLTKEKQEDMISWIKEYYYLFITKYLRSVHFGL